MSLLSRVNAADSSRSIYSPSRCCSRLRWLRSTGGFQSSVGGGVAGVVKITSAWTAWIGGTLLWLWLSHLNDFGYCDCGPLIISSRTLEPIMGWGRGRWLTKKGTHIARSGYSFLGRLTINSTHPSYGIDCPFVAYRLKLPHGLRSSSSGCAGWLGINFSLQDQSMMLTCEPVSSSTVTA